MGIWYKKTQQIAPSTRHSPMHMLDANSVLLNLLIPALLLLADVLSHILRLEDRAIRITVAADLVGILVENTADSINTLLASLHDGLGNITDAGRAIPLLPPATTWLPPPAPPGLLFFLF